MQDWTDFDQMLRQLAEIDLKISAAADTRDRAVLAAQTTYDKATSSLVARKESLEQELEASYRTRRKEVEAEGRRSIDLNFGRAGMRKGNPTLALLKGWKWDRVLAVIKERWAKNKSLLESLVATKQSVNKDGIKAKLTADQLAEIGLRLKQEDEFFYETFPDKVSQQAA